MAKEYIEREAAIKRFNFAVLDCLGMEPTIRAGDIIKALESIPAADVRPVVKSKWADNHVSFYRGCPECGAFVRANLDEVFLRDFPSAVGKLNFCPNCGADMRETEDEKT